MILLSSKLAALQPAYCISRFPQLRGVLGIVCPFTPPPFPAPSTQGCMRPGSSPKTPFASPPDSRKGIGRKSPCFSFLSGAVPLHSLHNRRFLKSSAFFHRLPGSPCRSLSQTAGEWPVIFRRPGPLFSGSLKPQRKEAFSFAIPDRKQQTDSGNHPEVSGTIGRVNRKRSDITFSPLFNGTGGS